MQNPNSKNLYIVISILSIAFILVAGALVKLVFEDKTEFQANPELQKATKDFLEVSESFEGTLKQVITRLETRSELLGIKSDFQTNKDYTEATKKIEAIKNRLTDAYKNSEGTSKSDWEEIKTSLETLMEDLKSKKPSILYSFDNSIESLRLKEK